MPDLTTENGHCLCNAVQITAITMHHNVGACHCIMCRRWGGGPLMAVDCGTDVNFSGEENIAVFKSSDWAERGFCKLCGSHLFYRLRESNQFMMPIDLFDNVDEIFFDHQIFIEEKPDYYSFTNKTKNMTGEELFAMYSPSKID